MNAGPFIKLHFGNWARWPEVVKYAETHNTTWEEAVIRLVNSGLSHEPPS